MISANHQSSHRIVSVSIVGGFLDGAKFEFADGLNCLIGARGAGKTTVVELIRYCLDLLPRDDPSERRRIESLVEKNLAGGRVEVTIETKDGLRYLVTRPAGEPPLVQTADGKPTDITLATGSLFKADIYSQNQVERIADRSSSQLSLIDNFQLQRISEINGQLARIGNDLATNASRLLPLADQIASLSEELSTLPGVEERLKQFAAETGDDAEAINKAHAEKALRDRQHRVLAQLRRDVQDYARSLTGHTDQLIRQAKSLDGLDVAQGPHGSIFRHVQKEIAECGGAVDWLIREAADRLATCQQRLAAAARVLHNQHQQQELAFQALLEKHEAARGQAAERAQLERRRNELLAKAHQLRELKKQQASLQEQRDELLARRSELLDERFEVRQSVAAWINKNLGPAIRVTIRQCSNPHRYVRLLEETLRRARLRHLQVAQKLCRGFWPSELAAAIRSCDTRSLVSRGQLNTEQAEKVQATLSDPAFLMELETVELEDQPQIELKDGSTYKESGSLSTGQKCTAVLPILLLDSDNPLLVDQPEDNLDNRFIFEAIVDSIRKIKTRRQMIFVTHNPNIPVLGDAQRVFVLDSCGDQARKAAEGTVDECKKDIVTLLEGGEDAFKARKCRYAY